MNRNIQARIVRVKRDNDHLGIMPLQQALDIAYHAGLDLVEIVPAADGRESICEILDYGKFKFKEKQKKKSQQSKSKGVQSKEIRLRPVSGDHDIDTKIAQLKKFLEEKHPVSVNIMFKNRELMHKDRGFQIMKKIIEAVENFGTQVAPPHFEGTRLSTRFVPKSKE